jgi:SWI/SNF-related matrix-associated actin-dependent regulator of chromatin subfamily A-like protein 1
MKITWWKGVFVSNATENDIQDLKLLKKAGFEPHEPSMCEDQARCKACRAKIGRRWWSAKVEDATRLKAHCNDKALSMMKDHLDRLSKSRATDANIAIPAPLGFEYIGYQKAGVAYALQRKDTLIGDEPGLGKTIQALGFVNKVHAKRVLVVAPATLAYNWKAEAEKWLVRPFTIFIPQTGNDPVPQVSEDENLLVITNYEKVTSLSDSKSKGSLFEENLKRIWDVGIFDEAQAIKNPESKRSKAILGETGLMQRSRRCLFLTGTPIENYPKEIWPIAAAVCPAKFGDWWVFAKRYCGLHKEMHGTRQVWVSTGSSNLAELQQRLRASFMVRRLKRDVLKELPPKRRQLVILGDSEIDWSKHPQFRRWKELYDKGYDSALSRLESAKTDEEYKKAARELNSFVGIAFEEMSEFRHLTAKAKLPLCLKYIDNLLENGVGEIVIFAHHKDVLQSLHKHYGDQAVCIYGDTPISKRGPLVQQFQNGEKKIFIGGMKAAGSGITLTRASTVVFVEIDWVPGTLTQAEDRLCRIGQKKMVHVIHLVLNNTLDVNMSQKVIAKQEVIDRALDRLPDQPPRLRKSQLSLKIA